jgi:hypothetical protein
MIEPRLHPKMRPGFSAIYLFMLNLIGLGIGSTAVAFTTQTKP